MNDLNECIEAYESAQALGDVDLVDFLPETDHPIYKIILRELVRVDLEYSWRNGRPRALEDYQAKFPELFHDPDTVKELAFEEFRLRQQAGLKPTQRDYFERFRVDPQAWPTVRLPQSVPKLAAASPKQGDDPQVAMFKALDRLLKEMHSCERTDEQLRVLLEGVRDSVGADAVFHCFANKQDTDVERAGTVQLPVSWCHAFVAKTLNLATAADDHLLLPPLTLPMVSGVPPVQSAAFLRISKSASAWVVALSFGARQFDATDLRVMMLARRVLLAQRQHVHSYSKLKDALFGLIHCLTAMIDARDPYTCGHSERVARIAVRLGKQMKLSGHVQSDLYLAGLLHDVGKIGISDQVLHKQGALTPEEFADIKEHVVVGDRIVSKVKELASLRLGVRNHHERFDGKGYPDGLTGKSIPLLARVLAVADSCEAMMFDRPYRPALTPQQIDAIMMQGADSQWDAEIVGHFLACRQELYAICQQGQGQPVSHAAGQGRQKGEEILSVTRANKVH